MKKAFLLVSVLALNILLSCSDKNKDDSGNSEYSGEVTYSTMSADWTIYGSAQELVEDANTVFIGKVTGISFQVLNSMVALPPTEETEERNYELYTIYDVDVITSYMGEASKSTQVRMCGGLMDYRVEEQLEVMKVGNAWGSDYGIPIMEGSKRFEIGETYLFALYQFDTGVPTPMNLEQSVYNIHNPFEKHALDITAKDVISTFGKNKWDIFWDQWQKDNPDWETRLDKTEVEKALAE